MISFLGVFFNAGLLIFTTEAIGNDFENQIILFVVLVIFFLALKYCVKLLINFEPEKVKMLKLRHKFIIDRIKKRLKFKIGSVF